MDIRVEFDKRDRRRFKKLAKKLPQNVFRRHVGKSANKAMTPVSRAAKKFAPKEAGDYRKSIGKKKKTYKRTNVAWVGVGPRKGKAHYALGHLIEYGHRIVVGGTTARISGKQAGRTGSARNEARTGKGRVVGFVPAHPHLKPAMRTNKTKVISLYRKGLMRGITEEARKA